MDLKTRADVQTRLYKVQSEFFLLKEICKEHGAMSLFFKLNGGHSACNEALDELTGREDKPPEIEFPREKF